MESPSVNIMEKGEVEQNTKFWLPFNLASRMRRENRFCTTYNKLVK